MRISDWSSDVCSSDLELSASIFASCDVARPGQLEAVFEAIRKRWGRMDFLFHSIAWARKEDLRGRLTDCSAAGFAESMAIRSEDSRVGKECVSTFRSRVQPSNYKNKTNTTKIT